jgi:hypothetical protein
MEFVFEVIRMGLRETASLLGAPNRARRYAVARDPDPPIRR